MEMNERFIEDSYDTIKDSKTGETFKVNSSEFENIRNRLNNLVKEYESKTYYLDQDFKEYDELIITMNANSRKLFDLEEQHRIQSEQVLKKAREDNLDFQAIYGAKNQAVKQRYADEQLKDIVDEIRELKFQKEENNRRLSFLKKFIDMKIGLIKYGEL